MEVRVAGRIALQPNACVGPASGAGLGAGDVRLEASGLNGTTGQLADSPKSVEMGSNGTVRALVLERNGTVQLAPNVVLTGAVAARDASVGGCVPADCDDGIACTADGCESGACVHTPVADGTACNDGNACTQSDTCVAGACTGTSPVECEPSDRCHEAGECDPATGACTNPVKPGGAPCNDGNACTQSDGCVAGTCTGADPVTGKAADECHAPGTCDPVTGACSKRPRPEGTPCPDDNLCNGNDVCDSLGSCMPGTPVDTDDGNPCTDDWCVPSTGEVQHGPTFAGAPCPDSDPCNGVETCDANGACTPGVPNFDDGNPCTVDSCDPGTGVSHTPAPSGQPCPDGNGCNGEETCDGAGTCVAATVVLLSDGDPCTIDSCDAATGTITHTRASAGASCANGDVCDGEETCDAAGTCIPGMPPVVDDGDPATLDACDPVLGVRHTAIPTLDNTTATLLYSATSFLCTGPDAIQAGVQAGTIDVQRAGVVRGKVLQRDGAPLPAVRVSILDHPELGTSASRMDGSFGLVVNAGGALTVQYDKPGWSDSGRRDGHPAPDGLRPNAAASIDEAGATGSTGRFLQSGLWLRGRSIGRGSRCQCRSGYDRESPRTRQDRGPNGRCLALCPAFRHAPRLR